MSEPQVVGCSWQTESEMVSLARRAAETMAQLAAAGMAASTQMAALGFLMKAFVPPPDPRLVRWVTKI